MAVTGQRGKVRSLAYLALIENRQNFREGRICEMRHVVIHVACLLFVFSQGAWRCLNQNIEQKARRSLFPYPSGLAFSGKGGDE